MIGRLAATATVGRRARLRSSVIAAVGALAAVLLLAVAMAPTVTRREADRAFAQVPQPGTIRSARHVGYLELNSHYRAAIVKRVLLGAGSSDPPLPPGLDRLPAPGQVYLSAELRRRMAADPILSGWFPEQVAGTIGSLGISTSDQLLAYVGVPAAAFNNDQFAVGFGAASSMTASQAGARWYQVAGFGLLVVVPVLVAFLAACRVGAAVRRRRFRALSVAGMPPRAIGIIGFTESGGPALAGGLLGWLIFDQFAPRAKQLPVTHRALTGSDIRPTPVIALAVLGVVVIAAGAISSGWAIRTASLQRSNRPTAARPGLSKIPALMFVVGVALLAVCTVRAKPLDPLLRPALLLVAAGIPIAAVVLAKTAGRAARSRWPVQALLAFRRLAYEPGATGSLVAVVAVFAFALSSAIPVVRDQSNFVSWKSLVGDSILVRAEPFSQRLSLRTAGAPPGAFVLPAVGLWTSAQAAPGTAPDARALVANCDQLARLLGEGVPGCSRMPMLVGSASDNPAGRSSWLRSEDGQHQVAIGAPSTRILLPDSNRVPVDVRMIIGPDDPLLAGIQRPFVTAEYARIPATGNAIDSFRAYVFGAGPGYNVDVPAEEVTTTSTVAAWILLGIIVCALLSLIAVLALSSSKGRGSSEHALATLAAPLATRLGTAALAATVAAALGSTLAVGCGYLASIGYVRTTEQAIPGPGQFLALWIITIVTGALLGLLGESIGKNAPA